MNRGIFAHWPNRITALRFLGALALFAIFTVWCDRPAAELHEIKNVMLIAFWLFVLTAATDFLDGWLARRGNLITAFGRIADPFVDKVLILGSMIYLAVLPWSRQYFPAWMVVVILAREFLVTGIRGYVESLGGEFPADWFGKVKMVSQCVAVAAVLALAAFDFTSEARGFYVAIAELFTVTTVLTSVGSGLSYVLKTRQFLTESSR